MAILNISREVCEDFDDKIKQFTREYTNRFKFVYKEGPLVLIGVLPKLRDLDGVDARLLAKYNSYFGVVQTFNDDVLLGDEQGPPSAKMLCWRHHSTLSLATDRLIYTLNGI